MLRAAIYLTVGWVLIAVVAGLGHGLGLTVMLPATSLVLLTHMAFASAPGQHRELSDQGQGAPGLHRPALAGDLAIALALGYLEDLHQGTPTGTLCLTHGLALLALRWASYRLAVGGLWSRAVVTFLLALLVDLMTAGILLGVGPAIGLESVAVLQSLGAVHWHALATMLAAPALWSLLDAVFRLVARLAELSGRPSSPLSSRTGPRGPQNARARAPKRPRGPVTTRPNRRAGRPRREP